MIFKKILLLIIITIIVKSQDLPSINPHIIPLYGNASLGYYYAIIFVGNPSQDQSVIIDTGSGQLALPCKKCSNCGNHINKPFDTQSSKSAKTITCARRQEDICKQCFGKSDNQACTFSISYAEGSSLHGFLLQDYIQFQKDKKGEGIITNFGCTTRQTNLFLTQSANGIFGLAPRRSSKLLQKLYEKHTNITGQKLLFSLCLSRNGGVMNVGSSNMTAKNKSNYIKTRYTSRRNLYTLKDVQQVRIDKQSLNSFGGFTGDGVFIDSGTTYSYLPRSQMKVLKQILQSKCSLYSQNCLIEQKSKTCFKIQIFDNSTLKDTINTIFPDFQIVIDDFVIPWKPQNYFLLKNKRNNQICLGIQPLDRYLLGANWMVNRNIVFHLDKQEIQIYSDIKCSDVLEQQLIQMKLLNKNQPLTFVKAVFKLDYKNFYDIILLLLVIFVFLIFLYMISVCTKTKPRKKITVQMQKQAITGRNIVHEKNQQNQLNQVKKQVPSNQQQKYIILQDKKSIKSDQIQI